MLNKTYNASEIIPRRIDLSGPKRANSVKQPRKEALMSFNDQDAFVPALSDLDPQETAEWLESLDAELDPLDE